MHDRKAAHARLTGNEANYEVLPCPLCGSEAGEPFRSAADIVKCAGCETVYLRRRLRKDALRELYQSYGEDAPQMALPSDDETIRTTPLRREDHADEIVALAGARGTILDIGCGWGAFLAAARERGFSPRGIEITRRCADFARSRLGIEVTSDQFLDTSIEAGSIAVVTMNHVLEHLPEPREALDRVLEILEPGGWFCGIVPNVGSFCSTVEGDAWAWLDPDYHYVHYTPATLRAHLEGAGFVVDRLYTRTGDYGEAAVADRIAERYGTIEGVETAEVARSLERADFGEEIRFFAHKPRPAASTAAGASDARAVTVHAGRGGRVDASIVVPVRNHLEHTTRCIDTLFGQPRGPESFEVILVDDGSTDRTPEFAKLAGRIHPSLRVLRSSTSRGFAAACNAGAAEARGRTLVFLNNDTEPEAGWLSAGLARLQADSRVGVVGSKLLYPNRRVQHCGLVVLPEAHPAFGAWPLHRFLGAPEDDALVSTPEPVPAVTGACLFIGAKLFAALSGFSEDYRMYFEDTDLCFKARSKGFEVFHEPRSVVVHHEGGSQPLAARRWALALRAAETFFARWRAEIEGLIGTSLERARPPADRAALPLSVLHRLAVVRHHAACLIGHNRFADAVTVLEGLESLLDADPALRAALGELRGRLGVSRAA